MRAVTLLSFIVLAVMASVFASVSPAAAQGTGSDPSATGSAIRARSEGSYSPPRYFVPSTIGGFKLSLRFAFARTLALSGLPARTPDFSIPADLPARRRSL
jgi:hypothetical protein